jgi:nitroreductase
MDTFEAIYGRRSIRQYTDQPVTEELVTELIRAAMAAPSAGNEQPWHFVIIDDRKKLDVIPKFHPYAAMLKEAPVAIAVCGDTHLERHTGFWVQDCSAAIQNLLLAAHAKGLGACWLAVYPRDDRVARTKLLLALPEKVIPLAIVALGYPAEKKGREDRFDKSRIHHNKW